mgnify:FL=1
MRWIGWGYLLEKSNNEKHSDIIGSPEVLSTSEQNAISANREAIPAHLEVTQITSGPIPAPEILRGYDDVYPGAAQIIINDFQENSKHVRTMQEKSLAAEIQRDKRGQWMAFVILMFILVVVIYSLRLGNITFAGIAGFAFIGLAAQSFLKQRNAEKTRNQNK